MADIKKKLLDFKHSVKQNARDLSLEITQFGRKAMNLILSINIDWVFVFLASYFFIYPYSFWERLAFSVGVTGVYHIIKTHYMQVLLLRKHK